MLLYIIDGFNLIHKVQSLKSSSFPREDLLHYIKNNRLTGSRTNKVIVVFDGAPSPDVSRESQFKVIFSNEKSADQVIIEKVQAIKGKSEVVVVSDDREIRDSIKREGARPCRISDFIKMKDKKEPSEKKISYKLQHDITEELRKIWLKDC